MTKHALINRNYEPDIYVHVTEVPAEDGYVLYRISVQDVPSAYFEKHDLEALEDELFFLRGLEGTSYVEDYDKCLYGAKVALP